MKRQLVRNIVALCASFLVLMTSANAQSVNESSMSWRRGTAIILFAGIGGGILGLSTLSFYGNPQEHTDNITLGGLIGVLAGASYVTYRANRPVQGGYDYTMLNIEKKRASIVTDARPIFNFAFEF